MIEPEHRCMNSERTEHRCMNSERTEHRCTTPERGPMPQRPEEDVELYRRSAPSEEDRVLRAVLVGTLREGDQNARSDDPTTAALLRALSSVGSWKERVDFRPPTLGSGRLPGSESAYRRQPKSDLLSCRTTGV